MSVKTFMLHETDRAWVSLRRYEKDRSAEGVRGAKTCPGPFGYHNAHGPKEVRTGYAKHTDGYWLRPEEHKQPPADDPLWPTKCEHCDYVFLADDHRQVFEDHIYVSDDNREFSLRGAPPGAMWYADWMGENYFGPDGHCLMVVTPSGREWCIDSRASNCTMRDDRGPFDKAHRCWVRHGTPPNITVDKQGRTCQAGGGSIVSGDYHGFLRNGEFT